MENDYGLWAKYFSGSCTPAEEELIRRWINESDAHEQHVKEMRMLWENMGVLPDIAKGRSAEKAWLGVRERIQPAQRPAAPPRPPVRRQPQKRRKNPFTRLVVVLAIMIPFVVFFLQQWKGENAAPEMVTYASGIGERLGIRLNDGSMVYLSVNSTLRVPEVFSKQRREVELIGEGYFDIKPDVNRPFIVRTGQASVEVLGTEFNLRAYDEESDVQLAVTEGLVGMYEQGKSLDSGTRLSTGQHGIFKNGETIHVYDVEDMGRVLGWRTGLLDFVEAPFEDVAIELERWYDVAFSFQDSTLRMIEITASFDLSDNEPLGNILNVLVESVGIDYSRDGDTVAFHHKESPRNQTPQ